MYIKFLSHASMNAITAVLQCAITLPKLPYTGYTNRYLCSRNCQCNKLVPPTTSSTYRNECTTYRVLKVDHSAQAH